ncbi:MAG: hypothetical protein KA195_11135, partial [Burkholderiaceae bacterium]|nr:hypothetical protein [Burkholderiaceae bacterium]
MGKRNFMRLSVPAGSTGQKSKQARSVRNKDEHTASAAFFDPECGARNTSGGDMAYMSQASLWWGLAGAAVIVQLLTGTFHFLMLAAA